MVLLPTEHLGVVVLTNGMPQGVPEIIADETIDQIATGHVTQDWRKIWYDQRFAHFYDPLGPEVPANPTPAAAPDAYIGTYHNDYYGDAKVISGANGLALVLGPRQLALPMTHVHADTFTVQLFPESPQARYPIIFAVTNGKAIAVDIGNDDGPGTGQLRRVS